MRDTFENHRTELLDGLRRFVVAARSVAGVRQIALVGSIVTTKPNPKDIDVLVVVADDADLALLAKHARRLQGHAQSFNRGADVFVADGRGNISAGLVAGRIAGQVSDRRAMRVIAADDRISTTILTQ
jgi:predicted nucleotidyltransferase